MTIEELISECLDKKSCGGCQFSRREGTFYACAFDGRPCDWDLEKEMEKAKNEG